MSLTDKQAAFVREYLIDCNATQAAIRAGYSAHSAASIGEENLRKPEIAAAVAEGQDALAEQAGITAQWVLDRLKENVERAMQATPVLDRDGEPTGEYIYAGSVANGALRLLGQHLGMFKERVELSGKLGLTLAKLAELAGDDEPDA